MEIMELIGKSFLQSSIPTDLSQSKT